MRFLLLFILFFCVVTQSDAQEAPVAPEWKEFCPTQYCDAVEGKVRRPNGFSAKGHIADTTRNYWAERKQVFDQKIKICSHYPEQLQACYDAIRLDELSSTSKFKQWISEYEFTLAKQRQASWSEVGNYMERLQTQTRQEQLQRDYINAQRLQPFQFRTTNCNPTGLGGFNCTTW